jgi:hypothetical protein
MLELVPGHLSRGTFEVDLWPFSTSGRGPRRFSKALPSENGVEHPGEERWRSTCAWGRSVGYPRSYSTRSLALAWVFPHEGLQREPVESESFPIPRKKFIVPGVCIFYLTYLPHYFLHLVSAFTFPIIALCSL